MLSVCCSGASRGSPPGDFCCLFELGGQQTKAYTPRTHAPYELRTLGEFRDLSVARETCLDGHDPLASVLQAASPCQNTIRGARALRELGLADAVEHSFWCVLQL